MTISSIDLSQPYSGHEIPDRAGVIEYIACRVVDVKAEDHALCILYGHIDVSAHLVVAGVYLRVKSLIRPVSEGRASKGSHREPMSALFKEIIEKL